MSLRTVDGLAAGRIEPGALRTVRWLAMLGAVLVGAVIASSAWMRHEQAGLRCDDRRACYRPAAVHALADPGESPGDAGSSPPGVASVGESGAALAAGAGGGRPTLARLAHRISATAVTAAIAGVLLIGWAARPLPAGVVSSALVLAALTLALAVVGTRGMHLNLPIVTLANLVGGMAMLAMFGRLLVRASVATASGQSAAMGMLAADRTPARPAANPRAALWMARLLVGALLAQITLGGLVSAQFAGLACSGDLWCGAGAGDPWSMASWNPLSAASDPTARSAPQASAMAALQGTHRIAGVLVAALALAAAGLGRRIAQQHRASYALGLLALAQPLLGVAIAVLELPHAGVLAHNAGAALLLFVATMLAVRPAGGARSG